MINYFLQEEKGIRPETKQLIKSKIAQKRKYQPFHIDCQTTKKKLCYCINNPVMNVQIDDNTKQTMWEKYEHIDDYYLGVDEKQKQIAQHHFDQIKTKIQSLSRQEVVSFVKSIKKQKSMIGEMVEY